MSVLPLMLPVTFRPARGAVRVATVGLALALAAPQGALLAKAHLAASMGVPVAPFSLGELIRLKGAVENDAPGRAHAIVSAADLGPVPLDAAG